MAKGDIITDPDRPDLGGNMDGGDPASWCPTLWAALVKKFAIHTVLDVGCGQGQTVQWFNEYGCYAAGIDGLSSNVEKGLTLSRHDLLERPFSTPACDLVWSCEVAEHIDPAKVDNFLDTLANGRVVAMTHAMPGQAGYHHVNCQPSEYWIERMVARGYVHDWPSTVAWRRVAAQDGHVYFTRSGLVFARADG